MKKAALITLLGVMIVTAANIYAQDAREIVKRADENMRGEASYSEMTMTTERPRYTREISMKAWSLGNDFALIYISAPARDKGTAFLKRGTEIWNYVPGIDRTIKMPPSMMSQSWMGSDFSNDDLVRGVSIADDYTHKLLRSEVVEGHDCYVIEMIPDADAPVIYDKVIQWISKEYYLPVRVENYDEYGDIASTINFRDIKMMGGRYYPAITEVIPATGREGNRTILTTHSADFGIRLTESFFSIQNLTVSR